MSTIRLKKVRRFSFRFHFLKLQHCSLRARFFVLQHFMVLASKNIDFEKALRTSQSPHICSSFSQRRTQQLLLPEVSSAYSSRVPLSYNLEASLNSQPVFELQNPHIIQNMETSASVLSEF